MWKFVLIVLVAMLALARYVRVQSKLGFGSSNSHTVSNTADSATVTQCVNGKCYVDACGGAGCRTLTDAGCLCADGSLAVSSAAGSSALVTLVGALLAMVMMA